MDILWAISEGLDTVSFGRFMKCCYMFWDIPTTKGIGKQMLKLYHRNHCLNLASKIGNIYLVEFFVEKGATKLNNGMLAAARCGHIEVVKFFTKIKYYFNWNLGMYYSAKGGHKDLVDLFIEKGASNWDWAMRNAAEGGHKDLVEFFIKKGAIWMRGGVIGAKEGGHQDLIEFFQEKIEKNKLKLN